MMKYKVELYVPMNNSEQEAVLQDVFKRFCRKFGGATINPVLGGWIDDKQELVTDKIGIVYSYTSILMFGEKNWLKKLAVEIREKLKEDAVTLVMDGEADFY
jgi:hypothetical protein